MKIERLVQGSYQTNSYILRQNEAERDCIIIDTGLENSALMKYLLETSLTPAALILTHGHLDHIHGIPELRKRYPAMKVCVHKDDAAALADPKLNLSAMSAIYQNFSTNPADIILEDGQSLEFAGMQFRVIHTPGHTPGGICLYSQTQNSLFSGDSLFAGSIGRTDFPGYQQGKCHQQLVSAVLEKVLSLPEDTAVYPGHGPATTIAQEKRYNPFFEE